jgi:hypothetical protein
MAEGADDQGEDIEIGNENHCPIGTTVSLDPDEQGQFGPFIIRVTLNSNTPGGFNTPINGIEVEGGGGGSAVVATAIGPSATSGSAVAAQAESAASPAVLATNDPGAGVVGISTVAVGTNIPSAGVIGVSTKTVPPPVPSPKLPTGVAGFTDSADGVGVLGECDSPTGIGVLALSRGIALKAQSSHTTGGHANSLTERGGVFLSGVSTNKERTTKGGIAQLRLVPAEEQTLPTKGAIGDLYAHRTTPPKGRPRKIRLYLCISNAPVQWQQVHLDPTVFDGGSPAP